MKNKFILLIACYSLLTFIACKKNDLMSESQLERNGQYDKTKSNIKTIPTYPLDWENIDFMPTPPGIPSILVPWASGASRQITQEMVNDYKSSEGWTLIYNTFNTSVTHDNWYFILYNKYRGLIRMYYYVPSNANFITSANIVHTLGIEGSYASSSPIMNFADQNIVDVNVNSSFGSNIEQWQVARATWYALQYEVAYDQNMSSQNYSTFNFTWPIRSSQITNISINGTAAGSLTGTINVPGSNFTISPTFNIDASNRKSSLVINGSSDVEKLKPTIGQFLVDKIKTAITSGAQGVIKNLLSGLFKRKTSSPEENVNLKLNANINLNGQLTSDFLLSSTAFSIPGYDQGTTPGFSPAYNLPLGVFYLSNRPSVQISSSLVPNPDGGRYLRQYTFNVNNNSFQKIFNPVVTGVANITNIQTEVLIGNEDFTTDPADGSSYTYEIIGDRTFCNVSSIKMYDQINFDIGGVYVRISFDVVPNNGSATVRIAKTFVANHN